MSDLILPSNELLGPDGQPVTPAKPEHRDPQAIAADLNAEAIKARHDAAAADERRATLVAAATWARKMNRAFKGIQGAPKRRQRVQDAIVKFELFEGPS